MKQIHLEIIDQTLRVVQDRTNVGKEWVYHELIDQYPEYLDQTNPSTIKRYITKALIENHWKNTSKKMNWFVRC